MPQVTLSDVELKSGLVYSDTMGLPRPVTGSFASVYRMHCAEADYALRLFLRQIQDQEARYALISDFVQHDDLPYTVTFDFLRNGIKIFGEWLPALKMEWVEGVPFDDYIVEHLSDPVKLGHLMNSFMVMMQELRRAGIAHGDLQHGNIIMCKDEIRLVDYDGMFVPAMKGYSANEIGHRNYQHPNRAEHHFGPYLDNFSAWVIYASLRALQIDPRLMHHLGGGDDCLLFRQADFLDPIHSAAFSAFERHDNPELQALGRFVRAQLKLDPADVPHLQLPLPELKLDDLEQLSAGVRSGPRLERGKLPEWLQEDNAQVLASATVNAADPSVAPNAVPQSWTVPVKAQPTQWIKPTSTQPANNKTTTTSVSAASTSVPTFPPELLLSSPRPVRFFESCGRLNPEMLQWAMIINPLVWAMLGYASSTFTVDENLRLHGIDYSATVATVRHYDYKGPKTELLVGYTVDQHAYTNRMDLDGDRHYEVGNRLTVHALPSDPAVIEPLNAPPGTKQKNDWASAMFCFLLNILLEVWIWYPAVPNRNLARNGVPVQAKIEKKFIEIGVNHQDVFKATVSYYHSMKNYLETKTVSKDEYHNLSIGSAEIILCDRNWPDSFVFYKFCRYHPFDPSPLSNQVPSPLPPELISTRSLFRVRFFGGSGRINPIILQCLMFVNPLLWIAVNWFQAAAHANPPEFGTASICVLLFVLAELLIWYQALVNLRLAVGLSRV